MSKRFDANNTNLNSSTPVRSDDLILGFMGITDIEFIRAEGIDSGDEARSLAIANAQSAIRAALA